MIRMSIMCNQYNRNLPVIEMELQLFHDGSITDQKNSYKLISETVEIIEKIVEHCKGTFLDIKPRGKIEKGAQMAVFITINFIFFEQIAEFDKMVKEVFS